MRLTAPEQRGRHRGAVDNAAGRHLSRGNYSLPLLVAIAWALLLLPSAAQGAPKADLWDIWVAHDPGSRTRVDHTRWDSFLLRHVVRGADGINRVSYGSVTGEEKTELENYISYLSSVRVRALSREEQLAYWINLYNSLTVKVILDHYPVRSIRDIDISPGWFSDGPWSKKLVTVEGEEISLDDIEHRILRPLWKDPRIHYAVNCASVGCPNLQPQAFSAENASALLARGAREYVNHPRGARFEGGRLVVSSIYRWFRDDFGRGDQGVIDHLLRYADDDLGPKLREVRTISSHVYDWSLNDTR